MRHNFEVVELRAKKQFKDASGKTRTRSKRFWGTINPFNRNAAGVPKSREEIMSDLKKERDEWLLAVEPEQVAC